MKGDQRWQSLRRVIADADRFLLTTHVFPEGDAIGSEVALALHLRSLGKQVLVLNESAPLERYRFLTRHHPVLAWSEELDWPELGWPQVAFCLDVSSWDYLGAIGRWIRRSRPYVVSIDHHARGDHAGDRGGALRLDSLRHLGIPPAEHRQPDPLAGDRDPRLRRRPP
jgi:phosphoesterase RecJ-like protein